MTDGNLAQRLLEVSKALGWVEKRGKNTQQNYDFVRAVDVMADARDALHKHGVLWQFSTREYDVLEVNGKTVHKMVGDYSFTNVDKPDEVITGTVNGSAVPPGDKGAWVVTTGMIKYALIQAFLLPTGDDPEEDSNEEKPEAKRAPHPVAQARTTPTDAKVGLTEPQKRKLFATFDEHGLTVTDSRRHVIKKLVGKESTKQMSSADLDKVLEFFAEKNDATEALVVEAMASAGGK